MNKRTGLAVLVFAAAAGAGLWWVRPSKGVSCDVCARKVCPALDFGLRTRWGRRLEACCPHCAVVTIKNRPGVRASFATDFATGRRIQAAAAAYVEGSDVQLCHRPEGFREGMEGEIAYTAYDRCLPSLVSFETKEAARVFQKEHGGRLRTFSELTGGGPA